MTDHDTEHKGIIMTITEDADMDPKPYTLTAISIGLEGAATGMALAGGHWLLSLLFLLLTVLFAINGWRAVGRAPSLRSPIAEAVIQAYADGYTAGSLRQPSDVEVAAALRYLLRQGLLREGITIMAAKFAVAGMCSAMAEALEKEES